MDPKLKAFLEEADKNLKIDPNDLIAAAKDLAYYYNKAGKFFAQAEANTKKIKADLAKKIRANPSEYGAKDDKASESFVESVIPSIDEYTDALVISESLNRLLKALEIRGYNIGVLERLWNGNYFINKSSLGSRVREEDFQEKSEADMAESSRLNNLRRKIEARRQRDSEKE